MPVFGAKQDIERMTQQIIEKVLDSIPNSSRKLVDNKVMEYIKFEAMTAINTGKEIKKIVQNTLKLIALFGRNAIRNCTDNCNIEPNDFNKKMSNLFNKRNFK